MSKRGSTTLVSAPCYSSQGPRPFLFRSTVRLCSRHLEGWFYAHVQRRRSLKQNLRCGKVRQFFPLCANLTSFSVRNATEPYMSDRSLEIYFQCQCISLSGDAASASDSSCPRKYYASRIFVVLLVYYGKVTIISLLSPNSPLTRTAQKDAGLSDVAEYVLEGLFSLRR